MLYLVPFSLRHTSIISELMVVVVVEMLLSPTCNDSWPRNTPLIVEGKLG
jgi:hypothetical protein